MSDNNKTDMKAFSAQTYIQRRQKLLKSVNTGLILIPGHQESPINYPDNTYPFRQESSFLYYFGPDLPNLTGVIDIDQGSYTVFGDDPSLHDIIFLGPQTPLSQKCQEVGITETKKTDELEAMLRKALDQSRKIHYLPPSRLETTLRIGQLLSVAPSSVKENVSEELIRAVAAQRSIKSQQEIECIESALEISCRMQTTAMKKARPGVMECEVAGIIEGIAVSRGRRLAFPTIFTINGQTLHNHYHGNIMSAGDIVINDSGAEGPMHYASDITRTIPIGGKFTPRQRDIYSIVRHAQESAIQAVEPGVEFRDVHRLACTKLAEGLKDLELMKGDCRQAVEVGAHAMFFQCGLGHMMGLDVHDMEGLGEQYVGYTDTIRQSQEFGLRSLRLGKALESGYVITVEPGIYFIPELIDRWKAQNLHADFINYDRLEEYRDFGGVRIEDDILVTQDGNKLLGRPIPKTIEEVETLASD